MDHLVWIVGYKLSQIYNIPWIEFSRDLSLQAAASCLNFGTITKSHLLLSTWTKKKVIHPTVVFFFSWGDRSLTCGYEINWFSCGEVFRHNKRGEIKYPNVFLATPSQPSDFPRGLYILRGWDPNWMVKNAATQSLEIVHALIAKGESNHTVENRCAPQCWIQTWR